MRKKIQPARASRSRATSARSRRADLAHVRQEDAQASDVAAVDNSAGTVSKLTAAQVATDLSTLNAGRTVETSDEHAAQLDGDAAHAEHAADEERSPGLAGLTDAPGVEQDAAPQPIAPPIDGRGLVALGDLACSMCCSLAPGGSLAPQVARELTSSERALLTPFAEMAAPALARYAANFEQWAPYAFGGVLAVIVYGRWKLCASLALASEPAPPPKQSANGADAPAPETGPSLNQRYPGSVY